MFAGYEDEHYCGYCDDNYDEDYDENDINGDMITMTTMMVTMTTMNMMPIIETC